MYKVVRYIKYLGFNGRFKSSLQETLPVKTLEPSTEEKCNNRVYKDIAKTKKKVDLLERVYYTMAIWRFEPFLSVGLRVYSNLSGGLQSRK